MSIILQIVIAWLYGHVFEYIAHKHVLHNYAYFKPAFKNHFKSHHGNSRKNDMYDEAYENIFSSKFEIISLSLIALVHFPLVFYLPYAYMTLLSGIISYYILHKASHTHVKWGKKYLPWHYSHHMGKNQNLNWGVRLPIIDKILNTSKY